MDLELTERIRIYALVEPDDHSIIRYVGMTSQDPEARLQQHVSESIKARGRKDGWVRGLLSDKKRPIMIILEDDAAERWPELERFWIDHYRIGGMDLLNVAAGGRGYNGKERRFEKLSKAYANVEAVFFAYGSTKRLHPGKIVTCIRCGQEYIASLYRDKLCKGPMRFCSRECNSRYKSENNIANNTLKEGELFLEAQGQKYRAVNKVCDVCGKDFMTKAAIVKSNPKWGLRCSVQCANKVKHVEFRPHPRKNWNISEPITYMTRSDGIRLSVSTFQCCRCGNDFKRSVAAVNTSRRTGREIFCSASCSRLAMWDKKGRKSNT